MVRKGENMKNTRFALILFVVIMLMVSACGGGQSATATSASTSTPRPTLVATVDLLMGVTLEVGKNAALGSFLVDDKGMTFYLYTKDTTNTPTCYDACTDTWHPVLSSRKPVGGIGITYSKLGITSRTDGTSQVTYNGWPLYYYANDKAAGDVTGQGVDSAWYVISPDGDQITTAP